MKPKLLLVFCAVVAASEAKQPPWYKPCWVYLCWLDETDPVCAWDPHNGARLFRNDCEMDRHNFCYNRNYAIADTSNNVDQDVKLCAKLKQILANTDDKTALVQEGHVRVHFLEDPNGLEKKREAEREKSEERRHKERSRSEEYRRFSDRLGYRGSRYKDHVEKRVSLDSDSSSGSFHIN